MDKNAIKKYAVWARNELIEKVSQKALQYGIEDGIDLDPSLDSVNGILLSPIEKEQRQALVRKVKDEGYSHVMEEVAYTWFNRFIALRFMEVNGYLPSHVRVFTNEDGEFKPQILSEALHLEIDGVDMDVVYELKNDNKEEDLFKYLLIKQCNALSTILPGMFQKISDYSELLLPNYLLREGSVIEQLVTAIDQNDWTDQVQVLGWLYQYYNTEPKEKIDSQVKKGIKVAKDELPAKTQIFTPDWVVKYMVENSLGRMWIESNPASELHNKWRYFFTEAKQDEKVESELNSIREKYKGINPEQLTCIDPCMGSGHILAYCFDLLIQIYEDYGYSSREAAEKIINHNLYGLDIDGRAAQLAYFSIMMKGRQYDRRFFTKKVEPHIFEIKESNSVSSELIRYFCGEDEKLKQNISELIYSLKNAKEYGSLIKVGVIDFDAIENRMCELELENSIFSYQAEQEILPLINVAKVLSKQYDVSCTNPPYLGGGGMSATLSEYAKNRFPNSKNDLFALFIERGNEFAKAGMYNCVVTMQSWMFLTSYEKMRKDMLNKCTIVNLLHMDNQVMGIAFGTAVTNFRTIKIDDYKGTYNYIYYKDIKDDVPFEFPVKSNRFAQVSDRYYEDIQGSPIAYWISEKTREAFLSRDTIGTVAPPKQGLATADNNRFLRLWFEVDISKIGFGISSCEAALLSKKKYFPYNKGGAFRRWYGNRDYVVNWENDGYEIKNFKDDKGKVRSRPQNLSYYFLPAITWSDVTSGSFSGRYAEKGFMFDIKGSSGFPSEEDIPYILGLLNSKVAQAFIKILNPTMTTQVGDMTRIPVIKNHFEEISGLVKECIALSKEDWDSFETSWDFKKHPLMKGRGKIREFYNEWSIECEKRFSRVKECEEEINRLFIETYGLAEEMTADVEEKYITIRKADLQREIRGLISYAVGCMFGRYSEYEEGLYYAGGSDELNKNSYIDSDNIIPICDDDYFKDDITAKFIKFIEKNFGEDDFEENLSFISEVLGGKESARENIRNYFITGFYTDHCSMYSVIGSGKRPIYWLFDSGKNNGFKGLVYMHRYKPDIVARIRTDYVHELQSRYRTAIDETEKKIQTASGFDRVKSEKRLKTLRDQSEELHAYEEKIHHIADQMISIDLDDGVKNNYALFQDVLATIK